MNNFGRRDFLEIGALSVGALWLLISCATPPNTEDHQEAKRTALATIKPGMSEEEVLQKLGKPDEKRQETKLPQFVDEAYRWAYGSREAGGFATIGIVIFAGNGRVLCAYCPTKPKLYRAAAAHVRVSNFPQRTAEGQIGRASC